MNINFLVMDLLDLRYRWMLKSFVLLLLLFSNLENYGQTPNRFSKIIVQLTDSLGQPIQGASVLQSGKGVVATTNKQGEFQFTVSKTLEVMVKHVGFLPLSIRLETSIDSVQRQVWIMKRQLGFLDEVTVTASTLPKELRQIASSVSIIQKDAPELRQVQTIDEALAYIPGVMVDRSRGLTTTSTHTGVILRGTGAANRTLVLKDGVPINDAYTGGVSEWNSIATNSLDRIEVVRGPGSSIYGSSSMGGTINLVTQKPTDKPTVGADFRYGSMDTYQAAVKLGKRFAKRWGAMVFAEYKNTGGYKYMADSLWKENYQKPKSPLFNLNAKLSYDLDNGGTIVATADYNEQKPISGTATLYDEETMTGNYQLRYQNNTASFAPDILLYYNVQNRKTTALDWSSEESAFNQTNYLTHVPLDTYGMIAKISHRIGTNDLTVGADLRFTEIISNKDYPAKGMQNFSGRQDFLSFFVNDDVHILQGLHANIGLRYDYWSNRNGHFYDDLSKEQVTIDYDNAHTSVLTPKIGLTYELLANLRLRSVYASGFRAPAAYYMYNAAPLGSSFRLGNPDLKPERMRYSVDFGVDYQPLENLELSATAYASEYSDFLSAVLIDASEVPSYFNPGSLPVRQYINIGKVGLWGIESFAKYRINNRLSAQLSYFYNKSEIKKYETNPEYEGKEMNDNPRNIYAAALIYEHPSIGHLSVWGKHTGSYYGNLENTDEMKMDAVTLVDVKLAKSFGPINVNFTVNNLFDKLYYGSYTSKTSYYYAPGRAFYVGIGYQL